MNPKLLLPYILEKLLDMEKQNQISWYVEISLFDAHLVVKGSRYIYPLLQGLCQPSTQIPQSNQASQGTRTGVPLTVYPWYCDL